ncbi:stage II sporulation protein M, partial [Clostridium perfringens]|nr:stage II sporulation protein M [Clostridium perfringens]
DERIYFFSSLSHGVCELLIGFIIFSYSIDFYISIFDLYKTGNSSLLIFTLKKFFKFYFFIILILLLISAFLEVYVSNRIILFFGG